MTDSYDLVVIGAGSGGVRAARMAATYGAKVAIIEEFRVGGTCVIRGCVPKKLYVYAARFKDLFDVASSFGWQVDATFDWPTLVANKEKEITRLEHAYTANLEKPGVEIIKDRAVVTGPNSVHLVGQDRDLTAKYILVATGAHPYIPAHSGRRTGHHLQRGLRSAGLCRIPSSSRAAAISPWSSPPSLPAWASTPPSSIAAIAHPARLRRRHAPSASRPACIDRGIKIIYQTTIKSLARHGDDIAATFSDGVDRALWRRDVRHRPHAQHPRPRPRRGRRRADLGTAPSRSTPTRSPRCPRSTPSATSPAAPR